MKLSWSDFSRIWSHLGCKLEVLGTSWLQVWWSWADLGSKMRVLGSILTPTWGLKSAKIRPKSGLKWYPTAFGHPATVPTMIDWLIE